MPLKNSKGQASTLVRQNNLKNSPSFYKKQERDINSSIAKAAKAGACKAQDMGATPIRALLYCHCGICGICGKRIPIDWDNIKCKTNNLHSEHNCKCGGVAKRNKALACHARNCGFKSRLLRQKCQQ